MMKLKALAKLRKIALGAAAFSTCVFSQVALAETVDVMVLYSEGAKNSKNGAIDTYINFLVETANTAYENSNMSVRLRLVHSQEFNLPAANDVNENGLSALQSNAQVREMRAQYGADMVAMLNLARRVQGGFICGIGYVGQGRNGQFASFAKDGAFSLSAADCGATTFAHELGHNMGLGHSRKQDSVGGVYNFGVGYGVDNTFATIMAYEFVFNARGIERFSNPAQNDCRNMPCGLDRNQNNGADSAFAVEQVTKQIAEWMPTVVDDGNNGNGGGNEPQPDPVNTVPVIADNMIENASAESGVAPWRESFNSNVSIDTMRRFTGEASLKVSDRAFFYSGLSQDLTDKLRDGRRYRISAAMKLEQDGDDFGRMVVGINDDNGMRYEYFDRIGVNNASWNEIAGEFTLDTRGSVNQVFVLFYGPSADKNFYVDQVSITQVGGDPVIDNANNVVLNGGFEQNGSANWEMGFNGVIGLTSTNSYEGNNGLGTAGRIRWYDGPMQRITTRVTNNTTYALNAKVRMASGQDQIEARLYYLDDSGHHWRRFDIAPVSTDWVELNGALSLQAVGTIRAARLHFFGPQPGANFFIDAVELTAQ